MVLGVYRGWINKRASVLKNCMFAAEHTKSSTSIKTFCFVFASFLIVAIGVGSEPRDKTVSDSSEKSVTLK